MIMSEKISAEILKNYQIFDIRTKQEWAEFGVIKDAVLLSLSLENGSIDPEFLAKFERLADKSKEIAIVCATGHRSSYAVSLIKKKLGLDTTNLRGGMFELMAQGYETTAFKEEK